MITGLKIPTVKANFHENSRDPLPYYSGESSPFPYLYYLNMDFGYPTSNECTPLPFVGFRLKGNLLEIREGEGLNSIVFCGNQQKIRTSPCAYLEKNENNATYTIEINQIANGIIHRKYVRADRFHLDKNTLDIIIRKNTITPEATASKDFALRPSAYIKSFVVYPNGLIGASIGFHELKTEKFLNSFCRFFSHNKFIDRAATIRKIYDTVFLNFIQILQMINCKL